MFIISLDGNSVLLQKRSSLKKMWPNCWDISVGGHVNAGELGYQAMIRELKEEILDEANGKWEVPGGKIEFGETPEEAVKRELFEETGYKVKVKQIIPYSNVSMWKYTDCQQHTVIFFYLCELSNEEHMEKNDKRINTYKWIKQNELLNYKFLPGNKEAIEIAIKMEE